MNDQYLLRENQELTNEVHELSCKITEMEIELGVLRELLTEGK